MIRKVFLICLFCLIGSNSLAEDNFEPITVIHARPYNVEVSEYFRKVKISLRNNIRNSRITNICFDIEFFNENGPVYRFDTRELNDGVENFCLDTNLPYTDPRYSNTYYVFSVGPFGNYMANTSGATVSIRRITYNDDEGEKTMYIGF